VQQQHKLAVEGMVETGDQVYAKSNSNNHSMVIMNTIQAKFHLTASRALTLLPSATPRSHRLRRIRQSGLRPRPRIVAAIGAPPLSMAMIAMFGRRCDEAPRRPGWSLPPGRMTGSPSATPFFERSHRWNGML
jgi:hypothetical protein